MVFEGVKSVFFYLLCCLIARLKNALFNRQTVVRMNSMKATIGRVSSLLNFPL